MNKTLAHWIRKPYGLFVGMFVVTALADLLFGFSHPSDFIPSYGGFDEEFFSVIWFCEVIALITVGGLVAIKRWPLQKSLPWILAAIMAIALCFFTIQQSGPFGEGWQYQNFTDSIYHPVRKMVPYYFPFQTPTENDYMLFTSTPIFIKANTFILTSFLAGFGIVYLRKLSKINPS